MAEPPRHGEGGDAEHEDNRYNQHEDELLHVAAEPVALERAKQLEVEQDVEKAIHAALTEVVEKHFGDIEKTKTALIISPNAADGICHYAQKEDVDLIVISTHGRTGLAHLLIGSVAENVVRHSPCPVLSVRSPVQGER